MAMPLATPPPPIRLSVLGARFNPGSQITVHLAAPANGQAYALICNSPLHFPLASSQTSPTTYVGFVPAPLIASTLSCPISAEFYDATNGVWSYVAENAPVYIGAPIVEPVEIDTSNLEDSQNSDRGHDHDDRSQSHPAPTPSSSPSPAPSRPVNAPTPVPKPVYRRDPVVVPVERVVPEAPKPEERRVETSTPTPKATKSPNAR